MKLQKLFDAVLSLSMILASTVAVAYGASQSTGPTETAKATFAGGCFWCTGAPLR